MKIILSDAESHEEHNETKYIPIGQMTAKLWTLFCLDAGEIMEKE